MSNDHNHPFIVAAKKKHRFETRQGHLLVEDLFDLSLKDLDRVGLALKKDLDENNTESLLTNPDAKLSAAQRTKKEQFDVVKLVIEVKEAENKKKKSALEKRARRERLQALLQKKELEAEDNKSLEDIQKELAELEKEAEEEAAELAAS